MLEGLLPEPHNKAILDLAFDLATWHAYAKLRKHTEYTIKSLRSQTKELGRQLRHFTNKTCSQYNTKRLPSEEAARIRRRAAKAKSNKPTGSGGSAKEDGPDVKRFNLATYKIHALGDYADHIEQFGPTDCFTTQHVCQKSSHSYCQTQTINYRVSSNTGGSSVSISAQTKESHSRTKLQSRKGCNDTTGSMLRPS